MPSRFGEGWDGNGVRELRDRIRTAFGKKVRTRRGKAEAATEGASPNNALPPRVLEPRHYLCFRCNQLILPNSDVESWEIVIGTAEDSINGFIGGCQLCEVFVRGLHLRHPKSEEFWKYTIKLSKTTSDDPQNRRSRRLGESKLDIACMARKDLYPLDKLITGERQGKLSLEYEVKTVLPKVNWDMKDARKKLAACDSSHPCRTLQSPKQSLKLPTRLLDLGTPKRGDPIIKLILCRDQDMDDKRYVALSYCWGSSPPFTTGPSTLSNRMRGFAVRDMPATLRESVQVTRDLGIRYLWIDALCILQGGPEDREAREDWQRESAQMHEVYGNAYLTVVAAGSLNSEGGLFDGKARCRVPYFKRATSNDETVAEEDAVLSVSPYKYYAGAECGQQFYNEPLASRAWAYQEWVLSARLLVFMSMAPMSFVCHQHNPLNRSPNAARLIDPNPNTWAYGYAALNAADVWPAIVQNFTSRRLTTASDKLQALSGVAKRLSNEGNRGDYLAGLWRESLLRDLLWCVPSPHFALERTNAFMMHSTSRCIVDGRPRAPTWSWAAIEGRVILETKPNLEEMATVVKCHVEPASQDNEFGAVGPGLLEITCPFLVADLFGMKLDRRYLSDADRRRHIRFWIDDEAEWKQLIGREVPARVSSYVSLTEVSALPARLYCLAIVRQNTRIGVGRDRTDRTFVSGWAGIVVKEREGNPGRFHRVGYFFYELTHRRPSPDIDAGTTRSFEIE